MGITRSIIHSKISGAGLRVSISGTAADGQTLNATITPTPESVTGIWQERIASVWTDIAGETGLSVTLPALTGDRVRYSVTDAAYAIDSNGLAVVAPPSAPSVTASDSLSGRTLTISVDALTGNPSPSLALTTLTLDGADVSGDATGTGPWSYVVPDSGSAQTVAWEVTATNSEGTDTASGSEVVAANLSAPSISGVPTIAGVEALGEILTATAASATGNPTPTTTWQWERSGTPISGATSATYTLVAADVGETLTVVQTEANSEGTDTAESAATGTIAGAATAPAQFATDDWSVAAGDTQATVTISSLPSDGGSSITAIEYQVDGGSWVDSGITATGAFNITGLTNATEYDVALRAVNAEGNGTASATKAVTPDSGNLNLEYSPDGTPVVGLVDATDVTITIAGEAGSPFTVDLSDLSDGFEVLGTADATGTEGTGNTWTAVPPLYVYDPDDGDPVITYQWTDGDDVDISGETSSTYVQQSGDDTAGLKVVMTFTSGGTGVGTATAEAIEKPAAAGAVVDSYTGTMNSTSDASYDYYELTTNGTLEFSTGGSVDIELIGGGGGGGYSRGGGGGAGAIATGTETVTATTYAVVIGAGGTGGVNSTTTVPTDGGATTFDSGGTIDLSAAGGGRGGSLGVNPPNDGGCGGGNRYGITTDPGTGSVGFDGGNGDASNNGGGGGGGMGGAGADSVSADTAAAGGAGVTGYLGGTVCAGGAGGNKDMASDPADATGAGNGGDGGGYNLTATRDGAAGAAGRVVIRIAK